MSDIRFNQWLHNSGTGGVSQVDGGHVGIGTTNPLIPVGSGNTAILNVGVVTANSYYGSGAQLTGITQTTINNNADNRVITGSGTANTLNGEANLTFDGNHLTLNTSSSSSRIYLTSGNSDDSSIYFGAQDDTATGAIRYDHSDDSLRFYGYNNSERLRIDSTGNTHLGDWGSQSTIYGKARLNIRGADDIATSFNLANSYLHIGGAESTANGLYPISFGHTKADSTKASSYIGAKVINSASYESTALVFATRNVTTDSAPTERLRISSDGKISINHVDGQDSPAGIFDVRSEIGPHPLGAVSYTHLDAADE